MAESGDPSVGCIIVHHNNFPSVLGTIFNILDSGIGPRNIVVVDNSESPEITKSLGESIPSGVVLLSIPNMGYANAVNSGVKLFTAGHRQRVKFLLIATHETRCEGETVARLVGELETHPDIGVVGPLLINAQGPEGVVFSAGGGFRGPLGLPFHIGARQPVEIFRGSRGPSRVQWLDGAFCIYRAAILREHKLSEDYFLYFEETDYHAHLRSLGWQVSCIHDVSAYAGSSGIPPFFLGKGSRIYYARHGSRVQAVLSPAMLMAKHWLSRMASPGRRSVAALLLKGYNSAGRVLETATRRVE
ncbi:GT2 family glycosyltransferase [Arthrobacter ulcerisalmonis]|nr:glycosyltransferase [Arthrobacter ulcerisalmonis]MDQ0663224.1 GT2 family glycosyltransferase [Arthrobacter ulcerisalmonis]